MTALYAKPREQQKYIQFCHLRKHSQGCFGNNANFPLLTLLCTNRTEH